MATPDRLKPLLEAALQSSPFLLEDLTVTAAGRRSVVRVIVDRALAGNGGEVADTTEPSAPLSSMTSQTPRDWSAPPSTMTM